MARFKPGESGNPAGRPSGSKNRVNQEIKEVVEGYLADNFTKFQESLNRLRPGPYVQAYMKLLQLILPTKSEMKIDYSNLSEKDLAQIINQILQSHETNESQS